MSKKEALDARMSKAIRKAYIIDVLVCIGIAVWLVITLSFLLAFKIGLLS